MTVAASTHGLQVHEAAPRKRKTSTQRELSWDSPWTDLAATEAEARAVRQELATMQPRRPSGNTATGKGVTRAVKKIAGTPVQYMQKIIEKQMTRGEKMVVAAGGTWR